LGAEAAIDLVFELRELGPTLRFAVGVGEDFGRVGGGVCAFPEEALHGHKVARSLQGPGETLFGRENGEEVRPLSELGGEKGLLPYKESLELGGDGEAAFGC